MVVIFRIQLFKLCIVNQLTISI